VRVRRASSSACLPASQAGTDRTHAVAVPAARERSVESTSPATPSEGAAPLSLFFLFSLPLDRSGGEEEEETGEPLGAAAALSITSPPRPPRLAPPRLALPRPTAYGYGAGDALTHCDFPSSPRSFPRGRLLSCPHNTTSTPLPCCPMRTTTRGTTTTSRSAESSSSFSYMYSGPTVIIPYWLVSNRGFSP